MLPVDLRLALERELRGIDAKRLTDTAAALSLRYREGHGRNPSNLLRSADDVLAYAAARMPATWAAIHAALAATAQRINEWRPTSLLDVGAGTGAASWAAGSVWSSLQQINLLERDRWMLATGKTIARHARSTALQGATWHSLDVVSAWHMPPHDLVVLGYVLGEIAQTQQTALIERLWNVTDGVLVLIEPGTPRGFELIRAARQQLLALGAHIIAPCPHALACPMRDDDWCHFAQRVERSSLHRTLKAGERGFEDEKFSYLAAARWAGAPYAARVLRHPYVQPSRIDVQLCTDQGQHVQKTVTKRDAQWKITRKLDWGDAIEMQD